ncbi:Lrp/AsnC family leucine-responsive transcriptional regulator [Catenibacillus scindens]|uniref:Lrp/AsnC family leucine-responsive transcriptional regulator n=1 Tax=Catenibacillus scindens TaxID=673271 RepID=A0A7W8HBH6_9FIRM|nr:Lrp/AsnC family transcriptional regulator [Catenibacillus scindens]MBB5265215.1 Lrp/AsnC family leucine-responsive transcriptional regulator [Catenibacillus scindens]
MDAIDRKILQILQNNARTPIKAIAAEVYLSSPAVSARIEHLEKQGYITGFYTQINRYKLGYHITAFIELSIDPERKEDFYDYIRQEPHVLECNFVTGDYSMLLKVAFHSTLELDAFIGHLQKWGHTRTQIVFSTPVEPRGALIPDKDFEL